MLNAPEKRGRVGHRFFTFSTACRSSTYYEEPPANGFRKSTLKVPTYYVIIP